jgi:hypothetical protein
MNTPMPDPCVHPTSREDLRELLLGYLQKIGWPGTDGLTLDDVLRCYPRAMRRGGVPSAEQLLSTYPELAVELTAFFGSSTR